MNTNTSIVPGSLASIATRDSTDLASAFLSCTAVVLVDVSGSMSAEDARGHRSRYAVACEELAALQMQMPGQIAVIAFSTHSVFCPGGQPVLEGGGTDIAGALTLAKYADTPGMRFILISDGQPDDEERAIAVAKDFRNRIDTIYIGPETLGPGQRFLQRLALVGGGKTQTNVLAADLSQSVRLLLAA